MKGFVPPAKPFLLSAPPGGVSLNWKCISKSKVGGDAVIAAKGKKLGASMEVSTLVHKNTLEDGIVKFVEPLKAEKIRMVVLRVPPPGWDPEEREGKRERKTQPNMAGLLALNYTVSTLSFFFRGCYNFTIFFSTNREKMSRSPFNIPPEKHNLRFLILYQSTRFEQLLERRLFDGEDRVKMMISMTCLCQNPSDPVSRPNFIPVKLRKHCTWHTQKRDKDAIEAALEGVKLVLDEKVFPIAYEVIQAKAVLKELEEEARRAAALSYFLRNFVRRYENESLNLWRALLTTS